ncbi:MAG: hypothetical protein ACKVT1_03400 [Dehalococcoidia bacterium]
MKRRYLFGMALFGASLLAIPASVSAQGFPPDPPATFYGPAVGATSGQGVIAIVIEGGVSTFCGAGSVQDVNGPKYVVDVVSDSQTKGCGRNGRTVRFYFTPAGGQGGRLAGETGTWSAAGPKEQSLTLGAPLTERRYTVFVASDRPAS